MPVGLTCVKLYKFKLFFFFSLVKLTNIESTSGELNCCGDWDDGPEKKAERRKKIKQANPNWKFIHSTSNRACGAHTSVMKQARGEKSSTSIIGQHRAKPANGGRRHCGGALCKVRCDVMSYSATSSSARAACGKKMPEDCLRSRYTKKKSLKKAKQRTVLMISQKKTKTYARKSDTWGERRRSSGDVERMGNQ